MYISLWMNEINDKDRDGDKQKYNHKDYDNHNGGLHFIFVALYMKRNVLFSIL